MTLDGHLHTTMNEGAMKYFWMTYITHVSRKTKFTYVEIRKMYIEAVLQGFWSFKDTLDLNHLMGMLFRLIARGTGKL